MVTVLIRSRPLRQRRRRLPVLATALFAGEGAVNHVFVLSNQVTVRRTGEWSEESVGETADVIRDFFIFYEENRDAPMQEIED